MCAVVFRRFSGAKAEEYAPDEGPERASGLLVFRDDKIESRLEIPNQGISERAETIYVKTV